MELINLQRWYDKDKKSFSFFLEISYSNGRIKECHMAIDLVGHENLVWNNGAQYFESGDLDYKIAFRVNFFIMRVEEFINTAFKKELQGDIWIDDCMQKLLAYCREKEELFMSLRASNYTLTPEMLLPRPLAG